MASPIAQHGTLLSATFDPYQSGTTKAAATGIFENGNDLANIYASIIYGTAASATGITKNGADLNTIFAKIGTANYSLPLNGTTWTAGHTTAGTSSTSAIGFTTNNSQCQVIDPNFGANDSPIYAIPTGATKVRFTMTLVSSSGSGTTLTNDASGFVALSATVLNAKVSTFRPPPATNPPQNATYSVQVDYQNAAGTIISTTTFRLVTQTS